MLGAALTIPLTKGNNSAVSSGFMHQPRGCLGHWALPWLVLFKEPIWSAPSAVVTAWTSVGVLRLRLVCGELMERQLKEMEGRRTSKLTSMLRAEYIF